jgi:hypothetical protein
MRSHQAGSQVGLSGVTSTPSTDYRHIDHGVMQIKKNGEENTE